MGLVSPNPMVGAVVLDAQGRKVGEGYHPKVGEPHAEVFALEQAGDNAQGGTLYINLEPCNHYGRTPPCTKRIIESGIQRVVCGTLDPNPLVAGSGRDALQNARISVRYGFLEKECKALNEAFFHHITSSLPFVTVKLAMSLDGKIANRHGESQWITGPFARQYVHHLRQRYDAIVTTAETVLADNPSLSVRDIPNIRKQPAKVILDRRFRLNPEGDRYKIFNTGTPVWVVTSQLEHDEINAQKAKAQGIHVLEVPEVNNRLNLRVALAQLKEQGLVSLFIESGGNLATSLLNETLVNKLYLFIAPKTIRDSMARPAFGHSFQMDLPQRPQLEILDSRQLDNDWLLEARPLRRSKSVPATEK
jgi:diaminohydroxyphosphoribosylaminopyrimidine deaminase / 5-amino-6-(5-phosphoribosylamino)uracil reductase